MVNKLFEDHFHQLRSNINTEIFKKNFNDEGVCLIKNFIPSIFLEPLINQLLELKSSAYFNKLEGNAYLEDVDDSLPFDHAKNIIDTTSLSVLAYDQIPKGNILKVIYHNQEVTKFIESVVGKKSLYLYGCPFGAINVAYMDKDDSLRWHFDQSDFVVSVPLQDSEYGGDFEYVANIRSCENQNYSEVASILNGKRNGIKSLSASCGDLILFQGKNTLHRVTTIYGKRPRIVALFGYSYDKGYQSSSYLKKIRYGRTKPYQQQ